MRKKGGVQGMAIQKMDMKMEMDMETEVGVGVEAEMERRKLTMEQNLDFAKKANQGHSEAVEVNEIANKIAKSRGKCRG